MLKLDVLYVNILVLNVLRPMMVALLSIMLLLYYDVQC